MPLLTTSRVPADFAETTAPANGITISYVRGGAGPTLVLLHGYPQTWYMWRKVLPALAAHFTVIAPDLRGAGGSDAPTDGYGKSILAEDVHQLLVGLDLADEVNVVGHDIGTMVAYAYAAAHRDSTSRLVLIEQAGSRVLNIVSYGVSKVRREAGIGEEEDGRQRARIHPLRAPGLLMTLADLRAKVFGSAAVAVALRP